VAVAAVVFLDWFDNENVNKTTQFIAVIGAIRFPITRHGLEARIKLLMNYAHIMLYATNSGERCHTNDMLYTHTRERADSTVR